MAQQYTVERYLIHTEHVLELLNRQSKHSGETALSELIAHEPAARPTTTFPDKFIVQIDRDLDEKELQYFQLNADGTQKNEPFLEMSQCERHFSLTVALLRSIGHPVPIEAGATTPGTLMSPHIL